MGTTQKKNKEKQNLKRGGAQFFSHSRCSWKESAGQSLIEVMVGLAIGGVLIGAAAFAISVTLRSSVSIQRSGAAVSIAQDLMGRARAWGAADWQNVYGLTKGSSNHYYLSASGTTLIAVAGEEGVLDNDVTNGLVGEWKFDENSLSTSTTTYDATGSNQHGTLVNGTSRASSTCKIANCLSFNASASNYVSVPSSAALNFTTNGVFSISLWIKPDTLTSAWRRGIIMQESYLTSGFRLGFSNGGSPVFWTEQSGGNLSLTSSQSLSLNQWNYLTVVYNNQQGNIYLNGIQVASSTGTYIAGSSIPYIGAAVVESFSGLLDDVRYYNRALDVDEVKRLYSSNLYSRYFYAENVCRAVSSSSTITGVEPCDGSSTDDASTQRVTVNVEWTAQNGAVQTSSLTDFLTRSKNAVFDQTDWSGGSGQEGPLTQPNALYASGTNIDATSIPGSFKIQNLYPQ
jgi:prepilin-type N-terminal cleavage/methylation domain-containing protein